MVEILSGAEYTDKSPPFLSSLPQLVIVTSSSFFRIAPMYLSCVANYAAGGMGGGGMGGGEDYDDEDDEDEVRSCYFVICVIFSEENML